MFQLKLWLLMAALSVVSAINICMIMVGAITPFRIVMFFNVAVMLLEMLHWFFCWQYYKSSIEIKILLGLKVGDISKISRKMRIIDTLVITLLILTTAAEMVFYIVEESNGGGGKAILEHFYVLGIIPNLFGTLCTVVLCIALFRIRKTIQS